LKINILVIGGFFFLSIGVLAIIISIVRDFPSGFLIGGGSIFGATLGSLFSVLVGLLLIQLGTNKGRFSKQSR
jgi:hypothetical protein